MLMGFGSFSKHDLDGSLAPQPFQVPQNVASTRS
jgi:hypothetical protein